jgi:hypothetical protein
MPHSLLMINEFFITLELRYKDKVYNFSPPPSVLIRHIIHCDEEGAFRRYENHQVISRRQ